MNTRHGQRTTLTWAQPAPALLVRNERGENSPKPIARLEPLNHPLTRPSDTLSPTGGEGWGEGGVHGDGEKADASKTEAGLPTEALIVCRSNFAGLPRVLATHGVSGVDLVLADLGCSSMQLDNLARGFSFKLDGPLDLRMNPTKGRPASALLASLEAPTLAAILLENADEPRAEFIAQAILAEQKRRPIIATSQLTAVVRRALPRASPIERDAGVRRVFQALRIAVNEEFSALETLLRVLPDCLNPGARVAILTFHSGEDRRVKKAFQDGLRNGVYSDVARDVIRPSAEEIRANPRASSAKLRWARKGPAKAN